MNYLEKWCSGSFIDHCGRGLDNLSVALSLGVEEISHAFVVGMLKLGVEKQEEKIVCRISNLLQCLVCTLKLKRSQGLTKKKKPLWKNDEETSFLHCVHACIKMITTPKKEEDKKLTLCLGLTQPKKVWNKDLHKKDLKLKHLQRTYKSSTNKLQQRALFWKKGKRCPLDNIA